MSDVPQIKPSHVHDFILSLISSEAIISVDVYLDGFLENRSLNDGDGYNKDAFLYVLKKRHDECLESGASIKVASSETSSVLEKVLYFFDYLLLFIPSFVYHHLASLFVGQSEPSQEETNAGKKPDGSVCYGRELMGLHMSKSDSVALMDKLTSLGAIDSDKANKQETKKSIKKVEEGLDSYKSGWQYALHQFGLFTSIFYGVGTAVMVGFYVAQLALPLWALVPLIVVLVSANLFINMLFALDFTPKVFHWLVGKGALFEGLYHIDNPDFDKTKSISQDNPAYIRFGKRKRSFMRIAFVISTASALAVSALTYEAMMGTLVVVPMLAPYALPISIVFAAVTTLFLATLFVNNWKEVVYRGPINYLAGIVNHLIESLERNFFPGNDGISPLEKIAINVLFVVNGTLSVLGFSFLFMVCLGPMLAMLGPYPTYIGMGPGILAQLPNLVNFCADFAAKIVLKVSREIYPYNAKEWVGDSPILRGVATPFLIVAYLVRAVFMASMVTACFLPLTLGFLAKRLLNKATAPDTKRYSRVGSAPVLDMTFLLLEVNSNALAYAAALPAYFTPVLVFSWIYTFFQRGIVFVPFVDAQDPGTSSHENPHAHHLSQKNITQWFKKSWTYDTPSTLLGRAWVGFTAVVTTVAKSLFMIVFALPLSLLALVEWVDRTNSDAAFVKMVDENDGSQILHAESLSDSGDNDGQVELDLFVSQDRGSDGSFVADSSDNSQSVSTDSDVISPGSGRSVFNARGTPVTSVRMSTTGFSDALVDSEDDLDEWAKAASFLNV